MPLRLSIFLLSAAAIAYEVLLIRLFSIIQWQQFAAMVISLALLGYGASGSALSLLRRRVLAAGESAPGRAMVLATVSFAFLSTAAFLVAQQLPFNPLALVWDPLQLAWLLLVYLVLSLPFFSVGFSIGLALTVWREEIALFYQADLLGAGVGAAGVVFLLWRIPPERCLAWIAVAGLIAATLASLDSRVAARRSSTLVLLGASVLMMMLPGDWIALRVSEYKSLSRALLVPGAEVVTERSSPMSLLSVVRNRGVPLRYAPGLSLAYRGTLPDQMAVFSDGEGLSVLDRRAVGRRSQDYHDLQISSLSYAFTSHPRVLIVGLGGGEGIARALEYEAEIITVIERNPQAVELLAGELASFSDHLLSEPTVEVTIGDVRSFLASRPETWDLIQITDIESATVSSGGVGSAGVNYLYTVESFAELVEHLAPGGLLSVTRSLSLPPRDSLKLFATAWRALEHLDRDSPRDRLAMARSWDAVTLLVKRQAWSDLELRDFREWCRARGFDVAFLPDIRDEEPNRFNRLEEPSLFLGAMALTGENREAFVEDYKFHIRPATDDRPFFSRFFRWRALPELLELRKRGGSFLLEWGYLVVLATLLQALLAGSVLILLPLLLRSDRHRTVRGSVGTWIYFGALGVGFLSLEIAYIQRVTFYLGSQILAVATALSTFLVFAGLGSGWVGRRGSASRDGLRSRLGSVLGVIVVLCLLHLVLGPLIFRTTLAVGLVWRVLISVISVAPVAFVMGMPFPLALQRLGHRHAARIPWAWAVNGWSTVVSAALAPLVAIHLGLDALAILAAICYACAGATVCLAGEAALGQGPVHAEE